MRNKPYILATVPVATTAPLLAAALALSTAAMLLTSASVEAREATKDIPKHDGPLTLVISLQKQRLEVYDRNGLVTTSPISSGTASHPTPTGVFSILEKNRTHFSNLYYSAPMPNMQRITWSGVALHAGALPGYPASHGCIRLPHSFSRTLFSMTKVGTRVVVTHEPIDPPQAFAHARMPTALPPGEPVVPSAPAARSAIKSTAAGLGTVTAMLGVTPAVAAEAAIRHASAEPATAAQAAGPRTRAIARSERQGEIDARADAIAVAEQANAAASAAVGTAHETLGIAKLELREAGVTLQRLEQDRRTTAAQRDQLERKLVDFIKRQRQESVRTEQRSVRRQLDHLADAASNRSTEELLRRADQRTGEAERDANANTAGADQEAALEAELSAGDLDARDAEAALTAQHAVVARLKAAHDAAIAALAPIRANAAAARLALEAAKQAHARAVSAMAQFDKPATVLVSRKTGTLYIRQGYEDVFQAPVTIGMPDAPLGTHVFTAVRYRDGSETELDWRAMTVSDAAPAAPRSGRKARAASMDDAPAMASIAPATTAANALDRIEMSPEVRMRVSELLKPGSTLILSDAGMSNETGKFTDIIVQPR